jgi:endoglucanase
MKSKILILLSGCVLMQLGCSKKSDLEDIKYPNVREELSTTAVSNAGIAGVNWADGRDNFVDGWVIPSGLTASDSYSTINSKATSILTEFKRTMPGVNTVRLPINPPSVLQNWWSSYNGAIDAALSNNMKVILACWEGSSSKNGIVDNETDFFNMWDVVISKYGTNPNVYFEVFNEPHGYTVTGLTTLYANWLARYPNVPRGNILLGGTGYCSDVKPIGADSRFSQCLLSLHNYAFWANRTSVAAWEQSWRNAFGSYGNRTVVTEFGASMTTGKNYNNSSNGDNEIGYIQGSTNVFRNDKIASVYWPGLRDGDSYSMTTRSGSGNNITLNVTNASGVDRIRYGWGIGSDFNPNVYYSIVNRNSGKALDVNGSSINNGTSIIQWDYYGGNNQQWQIVDNGAGYSQILNRNSGKALDINGASLDDGAALIQWTYYGGNNQQWSIIDNGGGYRRVINRNSGKALDVLNKSTANGANIIQWSFWGGSNQQWKFQQQ